MRVYVNELLTVRRHINAHFSYNTLGIFSQPALNITSLIVGEYTLTTATND